MYFIECVGARFIKSGFSITLQTRLKDLQTASPFELKLLGTISGATEETGKAIHNRFWHLHHRGEWFLATEELRQAIRIYDEQIEPPSKNTESSDLHIQFPIQDS